MIDLGEQVIVDVREPVIGGPRTASQRHRTPSGWLSPWLRERRCDVLDKLESACKQQFPTSLLSQAEFYELFSRTEVLKLLFQLLDCHCEGKLPQCGLIEFLKDKLGPAGDEFICLLSTSANAAVGEADLDFEAFNQVFLSDGVLAQLYGLIDLNSAKRLITIEALVAFITNLTLRRSGDRNAAHLNNFFANAEKFFTNLTKDGNTEVSFEEFKKIIPCKNPFFAERAFRIFDKDKSNSISVVEFRECLEDFCNQSVDYKVRFLFKIYDQDGDGLIQIQELRAVLAACTEENGMKFSDQELDQLTLALYEDAAKSADPQHDHSRAGLAYEQIRAQLAKQPGLLDNLSISLERFLLPSTETKEKNKVGALDGFLSKFSRVYLRNNIAFVSFMTAYVVVNLILFIHRVIQYADQSLFYIFARAAGQDLNFNCAFIIVLMLRRSITWLRMRGMANFLPLDRHVYLHKLCGSVIVFYSLLHTLMHLINFPLNIASKRVSIVTNSTHSVVEWLFTVMPGEFGLVPGWANLTGWCLLIVLAIMVIFSLPFVRKSGYFEIFYWTHLFHILFWILLILHGPHFWCWFIGPGTLFFVVEKTVQLRNRLIGKGRTFVSSAVLLPSRVTHLIIKKPADFYYHPGDYVYVNIPSLASSEWHPFTISSAPELPDEIWLHVRGAGRWTNKLYDNLQRKVNETSSRRKQTSHMVLSLKTSLGIAETPNKTEPIAEAAGVSEKRLPSKVSLGATLINFPLPDQKVNEEQTSWRISSIALRLWGILSHIKMGKKVLPSSNTQVILPNRLSNSCETPGIEITHSEIVDVEQQKPNEAFDPSLLNDSPAQQSPKKDSVNNNDNNPTVQEGLWLHLPLEVVIDGPYGTPSSHIFRAEHAVLIAAGIGVTPFASILQSIMNRYYAVRQTCPQCHHSWASQMPDSIMNLKKVDFFWINRDQRSFEWFVNLLSQLEMEQAEKAGGVLDRFLDLHMYITSALKKTDMKAVGLQMALDLLHAKDKRDLVTGLKTRTNAGRPNWDKVFQKLKEEKKGKVTVFYCGPPQLGKELRLRCDTFGFSFRKETF